MPRTKKPAGHAVDPRNGRRAELVLPDGGRLERFDLPPRRPPWTAESRLAWEGAWADPVAAAWTVADRPLLLRWIDAMDRAARALRRADRKPVVVGGNGQITEHPSYGTAKAQLAVAERCEQQLGFGALNRAKLGLTITEGKKSLAELNREFMDALHEPDPDLD